MELSEITISVEEKTALLKVSTEQAQRCSLIVQNKVGRPCYEKQYNLEAGTHTLRFPVGALKAGNYFVWLHYDNKTKMVAFEIMAEQGLEVEEKKRAKFSFNFFSW